MKKTPPEFIETEYGEIRIEETSSRGEPIRLYRHDGAFSSGTFLREEKKYEIVFDYPKKYEEAFRFLDIQSALMIGGAAYQYPKFYISHHEGSMDVVEINPMAEKIAREWFFLDDLLEEFGNDRLKCITADARDFLAGTDKKYDVIFNDAFSGKTPVMKLATLEAVTLYREHLNQDGIYMANVIGKVFGEGSEFVKSAVATVQKVFRHVYILYTNPHEKDGMNRDNYIIMASDRELEPDDRLHYHVSRFDKVLRD